MSEELIDTIAKAMELDHHGFPLWDGLAHETREDWRGRARSILAAIEASGTHVVVPVVMDDPMLDAAHDAFEAAWRALLDARPKVTE